MLIGLIFIDSNAVWVWNRNAFSFTYSTERTKKNTLFISIDENAIESLHNEHLIQAFFSLELEAQILSNSKNDLTPA